MDWRWTRRELERTTTKTGLAKFFLPRATKHVPGLNATTSGTQGLPLGSSLLLGPVDSAGYERRGEALCGEKILVLDILGTSLYCCYFRMSAPVTTLDILSNAGKFN